MTSFFSWRSSSDVPTERAMPSPQEVNQKGHPTCDNITATDGETALLSRSTADAPPTNIGSSSIHPGSNAEPSTTAPVGFATRDGSSTAAESKLLTITTTTTTLQSTTAPAQDISQGPPGANIFVPQVSSTISVESQNDRNDETDEDSSWEKTSPVNSKEQPEEEDHAVKDISNINTDEYQSHSPSEKGELVEDSMEYADTESHAQQREASLPNQESPWIATSQQAEAARETDDWEEVDNGAISDEHTGPATLETVPNAEDAEAVAPEPTERDDSGPITEFEWINTAPSEEPSIISERNYPLAVPPSHLRGNDDNMDLSSALVVSRGLPPFTQGVKKELTQLQEKTMRRQHEVRTRIHAVECQMARWTADLANERMDRQESLQHFMGECVYYPAGQLLERVSIARQKAQEEVDNVGRKEDKQDVQDETIREQPRWRSVEARISALETQTAQSAHALSKARRGKLLSLHDRLLYDVTPRILSERTAATTRERLLMDKVDDLAGKLAARCLQECAAREVILATTDECLTESEFNFETRQKELLVVLEQIRNDLEREQEERKQKDEQIQQQISGIMAAIRNAMLEAVGDPEG